MSNITTTLTLSPQVQQSWAHRLLSVRVPNMIHKLPADLYRMPRNGGKTLRMRRYNPLQVAITPLGTSGVTPPPQQLTAVDIDTTMQFYGTYVVLNEQVTLQNQEDVLAECTMRLGVSLRQSEDQLTRDMMQSTASFHNCVNGFNGDTPTEITRADISDTTKTLLGNDAYTVTTTIEGEDRFGTGPIRNSYLALCSTDLTSDIEAVPGFLSHAQYPSQASILPVEWGSIGNLRFMVSSIGAKALNASANGNTVYSVFCLGMEAIACIEQDGYSTSFVYLPPTIAGGPLALNATVGYKFAEAPRITNDQWLLNLRATLS
jgi:N4-gp56 family major capsid protein